jgi:hypothetical protein
MMATKQRLMVLLRASYDIMKQQRNSSEVLDCLGLTAHYDGTDCDGSCLLEDIEIELAH